MANADFPTTAEPSPGGGGSGWEQDIGGASWNWDKVANRWTFGFQNPDGSVTPVHQSNGNESPSYIRDDINRTEQHALGHSQGGSGGGPGGLLKALPLAAAAIPRALGAFGGGSNQQAQMPPELQQLLALAMKRMSEQEPLFQSINAQAMGGLPTAYQK